MLYQIAAMMMMMMMTLMEIRLSTQDIDLSHKIHMYSSVSQLYL